MHIKNSLGRVNRRECYLLGEDPLKFPQVLVGLVSTTLSLSWSMTITIIGSKLPQMAEPESILDQVESLITL